MCTVLPSCGTISFSRGCDIHSGSYDILSFECHDGNSQCNSLGAHLSVQFWPSPIDGSPRGPRSAAIFIVRPHRVTLDQLTCVNWRQVRVLPLAGCLGLYFQRSEICPPFFMFNKNEILNSCKFHRYLGLDLSKLRNAGNSKILYHSLISIIAYHDSFIIICFKVSIQFQL